MQSQVTISLLQVEGFFCFFIAICVGKLGKAVRYFDYVQFRQPEKSWWLSSMLPSSFSISSHVWCFLYTHKFVYIICWLIKFYTPGSTLEIPLFFFFGKIVIYKLYAPIFQSNLVSSRNLLELISGKDKELFSLHKKIKWGKY